MFRLVIRSKKLGETLVFTSSWQYVMVQINDLQDRQPTEGGDFWEGASLMFNPEIEGDFEKECRRWYRQRLRRMEPWLV